MERFPHRKDKPRAEELDHTKDQLRQIYIDGQVNLSGMSNTLRTMRREASSSAREIIGRMTFDSMQRRERFSDRLIDVAIDRMFRLINATPEEQEEIRLQALQGAKDYWENRLLQPDLIPDEIMLGRRRLTSISAKLEELEKGSGPKTSA